MKAHELARELLRCENYEVAASIDISTGDNDAFDRVFGFDLECVNDRTGGNLQQITLIFCASQERRRRGGQNDE